MKMKKKARSKKNGKETIEKESEMCEMMKLS